MMLSQLFTKATHDQPEDQQPASRRLLLAGGFIKVHARGLYSFLPLGFRVLQQIRRIIKEELAPLGGQEVLVPFVSPVDVWWTTGRERISARRLSSFVDERGETMVLSPSHEEALIAIAKELVSRPSELPVFLYQHQLKFRDEQTEDLGLINAREFIMHDGYSVHRSYDELNNFFPQVYRSYRTIMKRCGLHDVVFAEGSLGIRAANKAVEFFQPTPHGTDRLVVCPNCGYAANLDVAVAQPAFRAGNPLPLDHRVGFFETDPAAVAAGIGVPVDRVATCSFFAAEGGTVAVLHRGDHQISTDKLAKAVGEPILGRLDGEEVTRLGFVAGYCSPVGIDTDALEADLGIRTVVDSRIAQSCNLVMGGNADGVYYLNVNYGRDFEARRVKDVTRVGEHAQCASCGADLRLSPAVKVGHLFRLDDYYSRRLGLGFSDERGRRRYPHMATCGIGMGRLMAAVVEANHDDRGIIWPQEISPFAAAIIPVGRSPSIRAIAFAIHDESPSTYLCHDGITPINQRFRDLDAIGLPLRVIVSRKTVDEGIVDVVQRRTKRVRSVHRDNLQQAIVDLGNGAEHDV